MKKLRSSAGPARALVVSLTVFAATLAVPALAAASCPSASSTKAFSAFLDYSSYSLLKNGSFESGAGGWSLTGSAVTGENESFNLVRGSHSLAIAADGTAVSPVFCVSSEQPSFRLMARRTSGSWGVLNVIVRWTDGSGVTHDTVAGSIGSGTSWSPTPILALGAMLPLWQSGSTAPVQLVFKPEPWGGAWAIDDVFIDPYSR